MLTSITKCRSCGSEHLVEFLDLGEQYLSDFRTDKSKPPKYPLVAVICDNCKLVQLRHTVPQEEMYHERYGFKSGVNELVRQDLDTVVEHAFQYINNPDSWLDIASNDGTLLSFVPRDVYRVGVDPIQFLCAEAEQHANLILNTYFDGSFASKLTKSGFDVITSVSCFYDMPDPSKFVDDVKYALSPRGVWIIQQNYLLSTLQLGAVDNFCHEHLEYYTLASLEHLLHRFGLEVNEVRTSPVNGGVIRTVVSHKGAFDVDESVDIQRIRERDYGVGVLDTYTEFADSISWELSKLRRLVDDLNSDGKSIAILGASTRGSTIWQTAGIDHHQIRYAVERNPAKVGKMFSSIGVPIVSEGSFHNAPTNYAIIGPWFFSKAIMKREDDYLRAGGRFIVPLPEVKVLDGKHQPILR